MIVVADVGGTNLRIARADARAVLHDIVAQKRPAAYEDGLARFSAFKASIPDEPVEAVAVGIAGKIAPDGGSLLGSTHIGSWDGMPLAADLRKIFGAPAYLENDTYMGALGEAVFGAGTGVSRVAYLAVGTGIGGRLVVDGTVDPASDIHIGHIPFQIDGMKKELEAYVSGTAIERDHREKGMTADDPAEWDAYARYFSYGLAHAFDAWKPDRMVLGGALIRPSKISIPLIEAHLRVLVPSFPEIAYAALPYSGLTGALVYAERMRA